MLTDIEIERVTQKENILKVAKKIGLKKSDCFLYGTEMCKIVGYAPKKTKQKLILVTAINPTPAGEGKTTVSIGLADALHLQKESVCLALREPSLGPVFGMKGGACGGGYSQVTPMEKINLHFTGDFHAITSANNLLCAMIDNHIYQGNEFKIDINNIYISRCLDQNDRALREIEYSIDKNKILKRKDNFCITSASEMMAIFCLAKDIEDLKTRLGNILVAKTIDGKYLYARDFKCVDSLAILLKDAMKPNLVQTLLGTPAIIHGGPFANIAHGCNSIVATKTALDLADYTITEAGFGADLGAQKFLDVVTKKINKSPDCVVIVATVKALKLHGKADKTKLLEENPEALKNGLKNLEKHIKNIRNSYKLPVCVAINQFASDSINELKYVQNFLSNLKVQSEICSPFMMGGKGCLNLVTAVKKLAEIKSEICYTYSTEDPAREKISKIAEKIYGAKEVCFNSLAEEKLKTIKALGYENFDIIISKTQYSLSDNAKLVGCPTDFVVNVRDIEIKSGARFLVVICGDIMLMPGLPKTPNACKMSITSNGVVSGLS